MIGPCYDWLTGQKPIESRQAIDQLLAQTPQCTFEQLDSSAQEFFSTTERKTCYGRHKDQLYAGRRVYQINGFQRYQYVVGDYRWLDFLSGSKRFIQHDAFPDLAKTQYLVLDKMLLYKILALRQALRDKDYDERQLGINSGFRTPFYNEAVGGKVCSRHQMGDAVDIYVYDVNKDGTTNAQDAKIVYDILDQQIIQSTGGLGKYKSNHQILHFDTRGFRARWHY